MAAHPNQSQIELSIDMETLFTVIFVIVDDWYQAHGQQYLQGKTGSKPEFSDSEMLTLMLAMDILSYSSERRFYKFIKANYRYLFPRLIDRSQFNRRARGLRWLIEKLRQHWLEELGVTLATQFLLDTKPVPVLSYKRGKQHSDFAGVAAYGVCASRN
ncbi:MAG: IS982 family transposase, partial [Anaerolineae bacterium]